MKSSSVNVPCVICNKNILREPNALKKNGNYCSRQCFYQNRKGWWTSDNNPRWSGGLLKIVCAVCGKNFHSKRFGENRLRKYCSRICFMQGIGKEKEGQKHWNWKGGGYSFNKKNASRPKPDKCEICGSNGKNHKNGIVYDHDHGNGKFRGWLCQHCNSILGYASDDPHLLLKIIDYLIDSQNKPEELLELPQGQSAAEPRGSPRKVQRLRTLR